MLVCCRDPRGTGTVGISQLPECPGVVGVSLEPVEGLGNTLLSPCHRCPPRQLLLGLFVLLVPAASQEPGNVCGMLGRGVHAAVPRVSDPVPVLNPPFPWDAL